MVSSQNYIVVSIYLSVSYVKFWKTDVYYLNYRKKLLLASSVISAAHNNTKYVIKLNLRKMTSTNDAAPNVQQLHEPFAKTSSLNKTIKKRTICTLKIIARKKKQTKSRNTIKKSAERKIAIRSRSRFSACEREGDGAGGARARGAIYYWGEAGGAREGAEPPPRGPRPPPRELDIEARPRAPARPAPHYLGARPPGKRRISARGPVARARTERSSLLGRVCVQDIYCDGRCVGGRVCQCYAVRGRSLDAFFGLWIKILSFDTMGFSQWRLIRWFEWMNRDGFQIRQSFRIGYFY